MSARMLGFEARRKGGDGQFMTAAQIETRNYVLTSNLLLAFRYRDERACQRQYFVDDVAANVVDVNADLPAPKEIAGIEVYSGPSAIPLRYRSMNRGWSCAVILIWTKEGF